MDRARKTRPQAQTAEVVDFDEALLNALDADVRANVMAEAGLLVRAFTPIEGRDEIEAMARALSAGARDSEMDRKHARRLSAALRHFAREGI